MSEYSYKAEVVRWVDGDTVDVIIDLGFRVSTRQRLRLYAVNTPERGQEGFHEATEFCRLAAPHGHQVVVETHKTGKFGRWLAEVWAPGETQSINEALLEHGHAQPYRI